MLPAAPPPGPGDTPSGTDRPGAPPGKARATKWKEEKDNNALAHSWRRRGRDSPGRTGPAQPGPAQPSPQLPATPPLPDRPPPPGDRSGRPSQERKAEAGDTLVVRMCSIALPARPQPPPTALLPDRGGRHLETLPGRGGAGLTPCSAPWRRAGDTTSLSARLRHGRDGDGGVGGREVRRSWRWRGRSGPRCVPQCRRDSL